MPTPEINVYLALARAIWAHGEDGEIIARDLAYAFMEIVKEGAPPQASAEDEFKRFAREQL